MFVPHPVAMEQLRRGEIAAVVFITSKPVDPLSRANGTQASVPACRVRSEFLDYYVASSLESADYPNLIAKGERVATIAVPLFSHRTTGAEDAAYRRVERFVEEFFSRIDKLKSPDSIRNGKRST